MSSLYFCGAFFLPVRPDRSPQLYNVWLEAKQSLEMYQVIDCDCDAVVGGMSSSQLIPNMSAQYVPDSDRLLRGVPV
jgi:hypothetical protein